MKNGMDGAQIMRAEISTFVQNKFKYGEKSGTILSLERLCLLSRDMNCFFFFFFLRHRQIRGNV